MASHGSRALGAAIFNADRWSDAIGLLDVSIREEGHSHSEFRHVCMAELSPEEKQRIYLEEKARLEARQQVRASKVKNTLKGCLVLVGIIFVFIIVLRLFVSSKNPPAPSAEGDDKSQKEATVKPLCDPSKAAELIRRTIEEGIIYKIDSGPGLYPRLYVTENWYALPMDQKQALDGILYCWGSAEGGREILVKYYDYRTEKKIAIGGRGGLDLK